MIDLKHFPRFAKDPKLVKRLGFLWEEWARAYPLVSLDEQASWAHAWLVSTNKPYTDMTRFLNSWFRRCQQQYGETRASVLKLPAYKEHRPPDSELPGEAEFKQMREKLRRA